MGRKVYEKEERWLVGICEKVFVLHFYCYQWNLHVLSDCYIVNFNSQLYMWLFMYIICIMYWYHFFILSLLVVGLFLSLDHILYLGNYLICSTTLVLGTSVFRREETDWCPTGMTLYQINNYYFKNFPVLVFVMLIVS